MPFRSLGQYFRQKRDESKLTLAQVCENVASLTPSELEKFESGSGEIALATMTAIANTINADPETILTLSAEGLGEHLTAESNRAAAVGDISLDGFGNTHIKYSRVH